VEGNHSVYPAEQLKFYSTARGSVAEALAGMELLVKEGRVPEPLAADLQLAGEEISKMMWGLIRRKQRQIHPARH
jgi:four helix bundle protein